MPDERDDEYAEIHEQIHRKPKYIRFGFVAAMLAMAGFTVAANISLGDGSTLEFGQGVYQIKSCDQFVGIFLNPTDVYGDGFSRVRSIEIRGLDVQRCANTSVRIKLFDSVNADPLELFTNPQYSKSGVTYPCCTETGTAITLVISASASQTNALRGTALLSPSGKNILQGDRSQSLTYDANTGVFAVAFPVPLAVMPHVSRTTLESAPNV